MAQTPTFKLILVGDGGTGECPNRPARSRVPARPPPDRRSAKARDAAARQDPRPDPPTFHPPRSLRQDHLRQASLDRRVREEVPS